ncbi:MAG TPA: hypothetical protein VHB98_04570 [Chloroflexota bacterium]|jgi:anti-sigma factor RsiW|nr:hypothetical protein [Chloroflexota bacterium]
MNSRDHAAITPEDLLAYAAGEADPGITAHVAACADCGEAAAAYARLDRALEARLYRCVCPDARTLGELALELLSPEEALDTRRHLADCPHCAAELTMLHSALLEDPFAALVARPNALVRLVARLLPASGVQGSLAGIRGNAASTSLTFATGSLTLSLSIEPAGEGASRRWMLLGLVVDELGELAPANAAVRLVERGAVVAETTIDDLGTLAITDLASGRYDLEVALVDHLVVIPDIPVGAA